MLSLLVGMLCLALPHFAASGRILSPLPSASQLQDPGEQDEIQAGLDKCTNLPWQPRKDRRATSTEVEAPAAESFLDLGEEDVGTDLVGNNVSQLTLSGRGLSSFVNFQCTNEEMNAFKAMYGLNRALNLNLASFGYNEICRENNVVWLYPTEDHNSAFRINENVCHRLTVWSQKACSVQFKRVSSVEEASRFLGKFPANSVMHIVLGGHGSRGKSLQWGKIPHFFGVTEDHGKVPLGRTVSWPHQITTLTMSRRTISAHTRGYVNFLDKDGDVHVLFERGRGLFEVAGGVFLAPSNFERDFTIHSSSFQVITQLRNVMQQHASIFLDSCSSASSSAHPSLAHFVARMVGKGVRVIGSEVPFGNVNVRSFGAWHVSIHGKELRLVLSKALTFFFCGLGQEQQRWQNVRTASGK
mmetsp:Transcript_122917/g.358764  ORF Transcript_122917/g.358764 Transcript_122917/m.358764 type:complete len:413 (-) Transcript_122917:10-1248(-)